MADEFDLKKKINKPYPLIVDEGKYVERVEKK